MSPSDAGGRAARSALLELIAKWRSEAEQIRAATPTTSGTLRVTFEASMTGLRVCAAQLEAALEAAGLTAGDRPSSLFHAEIDVLASVNGALHAVHAPWRIDVRDGQAIAVPTPEIDSPLAAGDRPSPDPQIDCPVCGQAIRQAASATLSLAYWQHFNWMHSHLAVGARPAPQEPEGSQPRSIELLRRTLSMLCNYVSTKRLRPGEHMWTIPADRERDFDCILSDAISELEQLRALPVSSPAPARCRDEHAHRWKLRQDGHSYVCVLCDEQRFELPAL